MPYASHLEQAALPQVEQIVAAVTGMMAGAAGGASAG
jgi:hypothetical protein